jgi:hypothetical protein
MDIIEFKINKFRDSSSDKDSYRKDLENTINNYFIEGKINEIQQKSSLNLIDVIYNEKKKMSDKQLSLKTFNTDFYIKPNVKAPTRKFFVIEKKNPDNYGLKYLYDNDLDNKDIEKGGLNLSINHRPWSSVLPNEIRSEYKNLDGRSLFSNPFLYKPIYMKKYIDKYYIEPFRKNRKDKISPFEFQQDYINKTTKELCSVSKYVLGPQQKFCGQFICNKTDFPGLLVYAGLGSGKTATAITIAESMKSLYINEKDEMARIPERYVEISPNQKNYCSVTIVVPKAIMTQYISEITGSFQDQEVETSYGPLRSCTGSCIIYTDNDNESDTTGDQYIQHYIGKIKKDSQGNPLRDANGMIIYDKDDLEDLKQIEKAVRILDEKIISLSNKIASGTLPEKESKILAREIEHSNEEKETLLIKKEVIVTRLNDKIDKVYFIVSSQKFINMVGKSLNQPKTNENGIVYKLDKDNNPRRNRDGAPIAQNDESKRRLVASDYLKCKPLDRIYNGRGKEPHPDCFHSQKSLIIIDEVHKGTGIKDDDEYGVIHEQLFNALYVYSREIVSGKPSMKVVLLTATPVFDNPYQLAMSINLLRPRIPFPKNKDVFDSMFIEKDDNGNAKNIKNKLLFQRMLSGYVSYFKGGNPNGYPLRRNFIQMHRMKGFQEEQYQENLKKDLKDKQSWSVFDKDSSATGGFTNAISASICALPTGLGKMSGKGDYGYIGTLENEMRRSSPKAVFKKYSSKLYWIADKIIESSKKQEGPVFVYSARVARGILPLVKYLEQNGFRLLRSSDLRKSPKELSAECKKKGIKLFAIHSGEGYAYYSENNSEKGLLDTGINGEEEYKEKILALFRNDLNSDGSLCKVILGKIEEGISFANISQVHICDPWWNDSKLEQIIGRAIRYCSHARLPENRQYVDVYYHCNVNSSYDKDNVMKNPTNNLDIISVDQLYYNKTRLKNNIKMQFELSAKESAIDNDLNKYGNIIRLEEFKIQATEESDDGKTVIDFLSKITDVTETFYFNRSLNTYYIRLKNAPGKFKEIDLYYSLNPSITSRPVDTWPPVKFKSTDNIMQTDRFEIIADVYGKEMVKATLYENIKSDFYNADTVDKTFNELMTYAITKGEDRESWSKAKNLMIANLMFPYLLGSNVLVDDKESKKMANNVISSYLDYYEKNKNVDKILELEKKVFNSSYNDRKKILLENLKKTGLNLTDLQCMTVPKLQALKLKIDAENKVARDRKKNFVKKQ